MTEIQINQVKGQMEASIAKVEPYLTQRELEDFCDNAYTCIAYLEKIRAKIKKQQQENEVKNGEQD